MSLTRRQLDLLRFVRDYIRQHSIAPTLDEIGSHMGISKITAHEHVIHLCAKGALMRAGRRSRAIQVLIDPDARTRFDAAGDALPILGTIAAGKPILAIENPETWSLTEILRPNRKHYLLRVKGDSMIDAHITDGDLVVVEERAYANNGDIVVAVLPNEEATLKYFFREGGRIRLQPANAALAPVHVPDVTIRGIVVGVIRSI